MKKVKSFRFIIVFGLCILFAPSSSGQQTENKVIYVPEVIVREKHSDFFSEDQTSIHVPEKAISLYRQQSLGVLLNQESPALLRSYGSAGSLISLSLHGTGSNHTSVTWNGFPLNSPSSGQADLSLIPSGFMQSVEIVNGASGALYGSGTFGGLVELSNTADWNNKFSAIVSGNAGSFSTGGLFAMIRAGNKKLQYDIAVTNIKAANDFKYRDIYQPGSPLTRLENNGYGNKGIMQNIYFNAGKGNHFEAGSWIQNKDKELPALMGSFTGANAFQNDFITRTYLNYSKRFINSSFAVKTAYLSDLMHYTDKINASDDFYSVDSEIKTSRLMTGMEYMHAVSSLITAGAGGAFVHTGSETNNYTEDVNESDYSLYGNLKLSLPNFIYNVSLRQEFYKGIDPLLQVSSGFRLKAGNRVILRSNISNKFRKPTLNEKYWRPGGNPDLRPEKGWGGDISLEIDLTGKDDNFQLNMLATAYFQSVDNWIQWVMRDSLTPVEYKKVHARGAEAIINMHLPLREEFYIEGSLNYGFNVSTIMDTYDNQRSIINKQLVYVPESVSRLNIDVYFKGLRAGFYSSYTGTRQTVETADPWLELPPFFVADIVTGYERNINGIDSELLLRIENVFNTRYEVIRSYPMPGRAFYFTLRFTFNKNSL